MSTAADLRPNPESLRHTARTAGWFYLLNIATILLAVALFRGIVVFGDAAATATHLQSSASRFRLAIALEVFSTACSITVAVLLYVLLRPVNRIVSLLAAFF